MSCKVKSVECIGRDTQAQGCKAVWCVCSEEDKIIPWAAIICTAGTLVVPSSASIFNEWALKRNTETSIHLQNFFLYLFGLLLNTVGLVVVSVRDGRPIASLFAGQSKVHL